MDQDDSHSVPDALFLINNLKILPQSLMTKIQMLSRDGNGYCPRAGLQNCEMVRNPHCLDNRLIDGSEVVSFRRRPCSTEETFFSVSGTYFYYRLTNPQGLVRLEVVGTFKKSTTSSDIEPATFGFLV
jgi:hypothetical protein